MQNYVAISLGAGVQSSVMLLMAELNLITPKPNIAIFADTGWEPPQVYTHLEWLRSQTTIPIEVVTNNGRNLYTDTWNGENVTGGLFTTIPAYSKNPDGTVALSRRQCTNAYKLQPIRRAVRKGMEHAGLKAVSQWIGISTDEIVRMSDSGAKYVHNRFPLIELKMSRTDCLNWFDEHYPGKPLLKSSCVGCPFHSDAGWVQLAEQCPEDMDKAIALDERLRDPNRPSNAGQGRDEYLHRSATPLSEVIERLKRHRAMGQQLSMFDQFGNECMGLCDV